MIAKDTLGQAYPFEIDRIFDNPKNNRLPKNQISKPLINCSFFAGKFSNSFARHPRANFTQSALYDMKANYHIEKIRRLRRAA